MKKVYVIKLNKSLIVFLILILIIVTSILFHKQNTKEIYIDKDYLNALRTADRYLYAWVMRDGSIAYDLISDNIKKNYFDLADFQKHFAGLSNPHHQAFKIMGYGRLTKDRLHRNDQSRTL